MEPTAAYFLEQLQERCTAAELAKIQRYFKSGAGQYGEGDAFVGVPMGQVFALAGEFVAMPLEQIEALLESPVHEARAGAVKIMAKQAGARSATDAHRKQLYDLYLRRIDRINNWDLVDLGAWDVIGRYLADKPRDALVALARSADVWERRTAMLATLHFVRRGEVDDAFRIAGLLVDDDHDLIRKATGGVLRTAGDKDLPRLRAFLDEHAATMPRVTLRYAIEHLDPAERTRYRRLGATRP